jgi:hypothetical protein
MRLPLLAGVAVLSFVGAAGAQAETIYTTDPAVVATDPDVVVTQPNVIATTPGQVVAVPGPPFGPFTPQYIVTQPSVAVAPVAAPREQVIERERVVVEPRRRVGATRERVIERERVITRPQVVERERTIVAPDNRVVVQPAESTLVTTGSSASRSCFVDLNGFERCY